MKPFLAVCVLIAVSSCQSLGGGFGTGTTDVMVDPPSQAAVSKEHQWLLALVGEWRGISDDVGEEQPGADEVLWSFKETIKPVGSLWIVTEGASSGGGQSFSSRFTLGYDAAQESFVGSWVDSMQTTQWTYTGELDERTNTLSLFATGPSMTTPGETSIYRDQLQLVDANHKRMVSSIQGEDGKWQTYMTVEFERVR